MKFIYVLLLAVSLSTSAAFAQAPGEKPITVYDPADAIHPFKLISIIIRPPTALLNIFIKGFYKAIDSEPVNRAFNIDYQQRVVIDEDY